MSRIPERALNRSSKPVFGCLGDGCLPYERNLGISGRGGTAGEKDGTEGCESKPLKG